MPALARLLERNTPDTPTPDNSPHQRAFFENSATPPACICKVFDAIGQNPTCDIHGWWRNDPTVLDLADHPDGPWTAALKTFGGSA